MLSIRLINYYREEFLCDAHSIRRRLTLSIVKYFLEQEV
jgi:hypothetical protein